VVTTTAYRSVARAPAITELIERIAGEQRVAGEEVDEVFAAVPIDPAIEQAIVDLAAEVGGELPVAVRSSATVEDLHGSSFAGQYRTVLNVAASDPVEVMTAVRSVWASLWHPAPAAYRRAFGVSETDAAMAVVIMGMIPADTAGVVFTADPAGSSGARIEAVEGLGESLVSGQRTPQAWVVATDGPVGEGSRGEQEGEEMVGDRSATEPTPSTELPAVAATALEQALAVEQEFGVPQDVEWAAIGNRVFVLQARPITVLDEHDGFDTPVDDHELTTAGIVEMVPGVLPALRWEINRFLLEEAFRSVLDSLGVIRGTAAEDRPFVRRVRGRAAIDFDQLREAAAGIPGAVAELETQYFGQPDPDTSGGKTAESKRPSFRARLVTQLEGLARDIRTVQTRRNVIEQAEVLILSTATLGDRLPALEGRTDEDVLAYLQRLIDLAARGLAAELGVAAAGAAAYRRLELQLGKHLGQDEGRHWTQRVTARAGVSLQRRRSSSAAVFGGPTWHEIGAQPPNETDPLPTPPTTRNRPSQEDERENLRRLLRALPGWTRARVLTGGVIDVRMRLIDLLINDVLEQLRRRERAKAAFLDLGGEVRRVHHEIGRRLVERALLDQPESVELLAGAELVASLTQSERVAADLLGRRRNWLSRYEVEGSLPHRFTGRPERTPVPLPEGDVLQGWAAGPGRRRGTARVITAPTESLHRGEVLVAEATDASWSPLFIRAGAIVVERGGPLSHAAILARELGLPAVLNVAGATRLLDGKVISVDGDQGVVVIEGESGAGNGGGERDGPSRP
jgi:pyruvate,water dikinase